MIGTPYTTKIATFLGSNKKPSFFLHWSWIVKVHRPFKKRKFLRKWNTLRRLGHVSWGRLGWYLPEFKFTALPLFEWQFRKSDVIFVQPIWWFQKGISNWCEIQFLDRTSKTGKFPPFSPAVIMKRTPKGVCHFITWVSTLKNWRNPESPRDNTWQSLGLILS